MKTGRSFWVILFLITITLAAALLVGDRLFYRALYFWIGLIVVSWFWTKYSLAGVSLKRINRHQRLEVGSYLDERYELSNQSRLGKIWIEVDDKAPISRQAGSRVITLIAKDSTKIFNVRYYVPRRGTYILGPTHLKSGDLFGIFTNEIQVTGSSQVLVTPPIMDFKAVDEPHGILSGGKAKQTRSGEITPYAAGVREYVPGDPLNKIHWQSTARNRKFMVKEFDQDPQSDVYLFLDLNKECQWDIADELVSRTYWLLDQRRKATLPKASVDYLVSIAASLAKAYIGQGKSVGLVFEDADLVTLRAERGERQYIKILEAVSFVSGVGSITSNGLISAQREYIIRGNQVWLLTASTDSDVSAGVKQLIFQGVDPRVVCINPASFGVQRDLDKLEQELKQLGASPLIINQTDSVEELNSAINSELSGMNNIFRYN